MQTKHGTVRWHIYGEDFWQQACIAQYLAAYIKSCLECKKRKHGTCNATRNNKMKHFACTVSMALQQTSFTKCYIEDQHKIIAEKLYFKPRKRIYSGCLGTAVSQSCLYFYETLFSGTFAFIRGTFDCERCIKFMSVIVSTSDRLWRQSPKIQLGPRTGGVEPEKKKLGPGILNIYDGSVRFVSFIYIWR